jgi:protein-L-isoaspartate(D-aspartate) O-methyltransferase
MKMDIVQARTNMIKQQCRTWGVSNSHILALLEKVPREDFVPARYKHFAFADMAIPLWHGQAMLFPKQEARILDALDIRLHERILEIGTGSGYFTALLAHLGKHVDSVDIFEDFTASAAQKLQAHNMHNIDLQTGDASLGYKKNTHYDVIIIASGLPHLPKHLLSQLNTGGRVFVFLGKAPAMQATVITKQTQTEFKTNILFETVVVPLIYTYTSDEFVF